MIAILFVAHDYCYFHAYLHTLYFDEALTSIALVSGPVFLYWNPRVVMMPTLSALAAPQVAVSVDKVGIMTILCCQCPTNLQNAEWLDTRSKK